jgi:hypothetical protein
MSEQQANKVYSGSADETRALILHIRKRKWRYLILMLIAGAYSFYLLKYRILEYSSTATFFVNDNSIISSSTLELKALESISTVDNFNRIYQLINSAPTQKHLIEKFHLLQHYGIDSTKEFSFQKAAARLRSQIEVKKNPYNAISVTVKDRYRYLSSEMANEIVDFLEKLNQEFYLNNIQKKVQISQAYVAQLERDNAVKSTGVDSLILKINHLLSSGHLSERSSFDLIIQQQKLSQLITTFQASANELINSQKLYNLSLQALNFKSFPTITILQSAMPPYRSTAITALMYSTIIMLLVFSLLVFQAYLVMLYKDYFRLVFTGK